MVRSSNSGHKSVQYNLRLESELMEWLKDYAQKDERSVNTIINRAIKQMRAEVELSEVENASS